MTSSASSETAQSVTSLFPSVLVRAVDIEIEVSELLRGGQLTVFVRFGHKVEVKPLPYKGDVAILTGDRQAGLLFRIQGSHPQRPGGQEQYERHES